MRKQRVGLAIAKGFLGLALTTMFLFMLFGVIAEAEKVDLVPSTTKSESDDSDEIDSTVQATMHAWRETKGNDWHVHSKVSSDVYAAHEKKNREFNCTGYVRGSANKYKRAIYPTSNLKWERKKDSKSGTYHEGSYKSSDGIAYSAKKKHPAGHTSLFGIREKTRIFSLYRDGKFKEVLDSPSQLEGYAVWPEAQAELDATARNNTGPTISDIDVVCESGG